MIARICRTASADCTKLAKMKSAPRLFAVAKSTSSLAVTAGKSTTRPGKFTFFLSQSATDVTDSTISSPLLA